MTTLIQPPPGYGPPAATGGYAQPPAVNYGPPPGYAQTPASSSYAQPPAVNYGPPPGYTQPPVNYGPAPTLIQPPPVNYGSAPTLIQPPGPTPVNYQPTVSYGPPATNYGQAPAASYNQMPAYMPATGATSTLGSFDPEKWLLAPGGKNKKKGKKIEREVIHHIFADCADLLDKTDGDPGWSAKLRECATGRLPSNFSYVNPDLIFRKGASRPVSVSLPLNVYEAVHVIMNMFKRLGNIFSDTEQGSHRSVVIGEPVVINWLKAKPPIRKNMVARYVDIVQMRMGLTALQADALRRKIESGIERPGFDQHRIIVHVAHIIRIEGLFHDPETDEWYFDDDCDEVYANDAVHSAHTVCATKNCERDWKRCTERLLKQQRKYCETTATRTRYTTATKNSGENLSDTADATSGGA